MKELSPREIRLSIFGPPNSNAGFFDGIYLESKDVAQKESSSE
jgi:hypothetical protein